MHLLLSRSYRGSCSFFLHRLVRIHCASIRQREALDQCSILIGISRLRGEGIEDRSLHHGCQRIPRSGVGSSHYIRYAILGGLGPKGNPMQAHRVSPLSIVRSRDGLFFRIRQDVQIHLLELHRVCYQLMFRTSQERRQQRTILHHQLCMHVLSQSGFQSSR